MGPKAVVIGAGRLGSAVGGHLIAKGYVVSYAGHETVDVRASSSLAVFFQELRNIDVLVYAVGSWGQIGKIGETHPYLWKEAFDVNLFGLQAACYYGMPKMTDGGHIIAFAGGGRGPMPMRSGLACAKTAVGRFVETLASEEPHLRVNAIAPGPAYSRMHDKVIDLDTPWAEEFRKMRDAGVGSVPVEWTLNVIDHLLNKNPSGEVFFAREFWTRPEATFVAPKARPDLRVVHG